MPTKTVKPKAGLFPEGTAVQAFPARTSEIERREGRPAAVAPTDTGVITNGSVEITGAAGRYLLEAVVDEVQSVTVKAKKGKFKLVYSGQTTAGIKYNATAAEVREALEALSNIAAAEVEVTGGPGDEGGTKPYVVKFLKTLAGTNVAQMTAVTTELEEEPKTVEIKTTTQGSSAGAGGIQRTCLFTID